MARGIDYSEDGFGKGGASVLAAVPALDEGRDVLDPGAGVDVAAGGDVDDGVFVGGGDCLDEFILAEWEIEGAVSAFAFAVGVVSGGDDDGVGFLCEFDGFGVDDFVGSDDAKDETAADEAALIVFDDDLVRAGGEFDSDVGWKARTMSQSSMIGLPSIKTRLPVPSPEPWRAMMYFPADSAV